MNQKRVVVGMSGGVDSSVAAFLLKEQGYDVVGITLKVWLGDCSQTGEHACCGPRAVEDARSVAHQLGIPFYVIDHKEPFQNYVIQYFCDEYSRGRTPNPCVVCNQKLKFGSMFDFAEKLGAWKMATGHYVRVGDENGEFVLRKATDLKKDQSYFLYTLGYEKLSKILFPLGSYDKKQVREIAKKANLRVFDKADSQEICFVPDGGYVDFLKKSIPDQFKPGLIVDVHGKKLGEHSGIQSYTIGQRKGLGFALGHPAYVVALDRLTNTVVVGEEKDLLRDSFFTRETTWMTKHVPSGALACKVKIRSLHEGMDATVKILENGKTQVVLEKHEKAITPGQAAVFYKDDRVLGGGFIE